MIATVHGKTVELVQGDITQQPVDAIVNAANSRLAGGGGVDGAIHRRGGPSIMEETDRRYPAGCPTGSAVISGAGNLPAKYVIHTVGPVWRGGNSLEELLLAGAHRSCLELAVEHQCDSIAFPAISTGVYGFPLKEAARVALETVAEFLEQSAGPKLVRFVLFDQTAYGAFEAVLRETVQGLGG
jgi:O-acetyl-ADP-ribose deacetylase